MEVLIHGINPISISCENGCSDCSCDCDNCGCDNLEGCHGDGYISNDDCVIGA